MTTRPSRYFTEFVAGEAETRAYRAGGGGGGGGSGEDGGAAGGDLGPLSQPPRFYSARECARLQGFPEDFVLTWAGQRNPNRLYHQLGNAVSPATVELIAAAMLCAGRFHLARRSILTEIYLCHTCSYQAIDDGNAWAGIRASSGHHRSMNPAKAEDGIRDVPIVSR
eukprot:COSAG01_NODE_13417_length_1588_cov_1.917394_2_plen_167_part_00